MVRLANNGVWGRDWRSIYGCLKQEPDGGNGEEDGICL